MIYRSSSPAVVSGCAKDPRSKDRSNPEKCAAENADYTGPTRQHGPDRTDHI